MLGILWLGAALSLGAAALADAQPAVPTPPFPAIVVSAQCNVRLRPEESAPQIGLLRAGARLTVSGCVPDCASKEAWALLGSDGAVRLSSLRQATESEAPAVTISADRLWYGRARSRAPRIYQTPDLRAPHIHHPEVPLEMALLPDETLRASGWFERVEGGYVQVKGVSFLEVSRFSGQASPTLPLVFILKPLPSTRSGDPGAHGLQRYDRVPLVRMERSRIVTDGGTFPRGSAAVVLLQARPAAIPAGSKWVAVDLAAQTLTAYEGDTPVYATLVSSGKSKDGKRTLTGLYRVQHKLLYSDMHGEPNDPYTVERVPYTQYFDRSEGLHGTYWHDGFGARASHGCVNLSIADAKWIFDWSPPPLPAEWDGIDPVAAGLTDLWVLISKR